jgi:LAO/AO transport system kinase
VPPRPADAGLHDLVDRFRARDVRGLARAISLVERRDPSTRELFDALGTTENQPLVIGLTGAPGTGKSTLADALVAQARGLGRSVAVIAVDPNSPFTGGAVFGDRIRMQRHALDPDVYIRSMGARGHLGGLSLASREAVRLLAAYGFEMVILETVGVGQSELEVAGIADTTLVVLSPGSGDGVQMIKAGIMEIADVFVVNKADRPGAAETQSDLLGMLELSSRRSWRPPIVRTVATTGEGVDELYSAIAAHRAHLEATGDADARRRARLREELRGLVAAEMLERADAVCRGPRFETIVDEVAQRTRDPYTAVEELLEG